MKFSNAILISVLVLTQCYATLLTGQVGRKLNAEEIKKVQGGIKTSNASTTSISARFKQEKNMSFLAEIVTSSGKFYYQKEGKVRWEYEKPTFYTAVINDGRIYVDNGKNKNAFDMRSGKIFKELNAMMIQCISGSISENANYRVSYTYTAKNYIVMLEPKSKELKTVILEIALFLDKSDYAVSAIRLKESAEGDYTFIHFEDRKFNQVLNPSLFSGF